MAIEHVTHHMRCEASELGDGLLLLFPGRQDWGRGGTSDGRNFGVDGQGRVWVWMWMWVWM